MDNQEDFNVKKIQRRDMDNFDIRKSNKSTQGWLVSNRKYFQIGLGIFIVVILIFATIIFIRGWFSFSKDKVELKINIPNEIASGDELEFIVNCENKNRVMLKDTKLIIDYPQGTYSKEGDSLTQEIVKLGNIPAKESKAKNFRIRLSGEKGSIKFLRINLNYQPANINSRFENSISSKININFAQIGLYLIAPQKAVSGEEVSYILDYMNESKKDFSDLEIRLNYPSGFSFKTSLPESEEETNNSWRLKELNKGERGTIKISGTLEGLEGENKSLEASIGEIKNNKFLEYSQTNSITQISFSPLQVSLSLDGQEIEKNVSADEKLNYRIEFKNNTDISLSQLVLKAYFQGEMFDFKTLALQEKGFFDGLNNTITWSAAGVPSLALLAPGESGQVEFSLLTEKNFSINSFDDKNFQISVQAELETPNVPPQFNLEKLKIEKTLKSKINSDVELYAKGYHHEITTNINNSGPIPPQVNKLTTYTIHWQITNSSNNLENIRVIATLPQGIEWQNNYKTLNNKSKIEYNERTKQITWTIDKIPAATGFLIPAYELVFQIGLRPSITQVDTELTLINESKLEAEDNFTKESLEFSDSIITTSLPDDPTITARQGIVRE